MAAWQMASSQGRTWREALGRRHQSRRRQGVKVCQGARVCHAAMDAQVRYRGTDLVWGGLTM